MSNPIQIENALTGSTAWKVVDYEPTQITAWCDKTSYNPGDTVKIYASQQTAGTYTIKIFRLGWYGGTGGCLKATINNAAGTAQGWWDDGAQTLHNCPTAISDSTTHNWETGWAQTDSWTIPAGACTGIYFALFTDQLNRQGGLYFVVKGSGSADYAYITPNTTDQAYNDWGSGYSLYTNITVGVKDSFNRPLYNAYGCATLFQHQIQWIHWLESQGYNVAYLSDIDVHVNNVVLLNYKTVLYAAHDEYWTKAMRDGAEVALAAGVGIGNLGANNGFWQCRLENDNAGNANRTLVCYKVQTSSSNLALDPQYGVNNALVTSQWRDPVLNRPENTLFGVMYTSDVTWPGNNVAWTVDSNANASRFVASLLSGTGLTPGSSYGSDCVGYEWDKVQFGGAMNVQVIGSTPRTDRNSLPSVSQTIVYIAASGALVFSSGSIDFGYALDNYRYNAATVAPVAGMQAFMSNIMAALIVSHRSFSMVRKT